MKEDATFYYVVWVIVLILALIERIREKPYNNTIVTAVFTVAAIIVACRDEVGADWSSYKSLYYDGYDQEGIRDNLSIEPVFMLIRSFFFYTGFTHSVFFLVLSLISLFTIRKAAEIFGIKYFMTVFLVYFSLFFLNYQLNVVRQGMMASFVWLAFAYKTTGNLKASMTAIVIALGFHFTALAFIPIVFFANRCFSFKVIVIIVGASFVCLFLDVSYKILSLFPILTVIDRTSNYVTSETFHVETGLSFSLILMLVVFFIVHHFFKNVYNNDPRLRTLANIILFDFLFSCVFNSFSIFQERVCRVLFLSMVFLLPLIAERIKTLSFRIVAMSVVVVYAFMAFPKTFAVHDDGYSTLLPYKIDLWQLIDSKR